MECRPRDAGPSLRVECVFRFRDRLGETPLWCERTKKLWGLDIEYPKLQSDDPCSDSHQIHSIRGMKTSALGP